MVSYQKSHAVRPQARLDDRGVSPTMPKRGWGHPALTLAFSLVFASTALSLSADQITWRGGSGDKEWSDSANWTPTVPDGNDEVVFPLDQNHTSIRLTPPLSYTGTMSTSKGPDDTGNNLLPTILTLEVLEGAAWKVAGEGIVAATSGMADRLSPDFHGVVDVRAGQAFVVPSTLAADVRFIGSGRLVLDAETRMDYLTGFGGRLSVPAGMSVSPASIAPAQQHEIELGNGAQLNFTEPVLAYGGTHPISDWNEEGWAGNCFLATQTAPVDLDDTPMVIDDAGGLVLINDAAQTRTAWFTNRVFRLTDSWGVKFRWTPSLPADSKYTQAGMAQSFCGTFSFLMQHGGPNNIGCDTWRVPANGGFGLHVYTYRGDNAQSVKWNLGFNKDNYGYGAAIKEANLCGIRLDEAIDFAISCHDGIVTAVMMQGDKSFSLQRTFKPYLKACGAGVHLGFAASSNYWSEWKTVPWHRQTISDFRGWYTALDACAWKEEEGSKTLFPFAAANYYCYYYDHATQSAVDTSPLFLSDGCFWLQPHAYCTVTCGSLTPFSASKRHMAVYEMLWGNNADGRWMGGYAFAFSKLKPFNDWQFNSTEIEKPGFLSDWNQAISFYTRRYQKQYFDCYYTRHGSKATQINDEDLSRPLANSTSRELYAYDPDGTIRHETAFTAVSGAGRVTSSRQVVADSTISAWKTSTGGGADRYNFYPVFRSACSNWGDMTTKITSFKMFELAENSSPELSDGVVVNAGASATLSAAATVPSSDVPAIRLSSVRLEKGATLNVAGPGDTAKCQVSCVKAGPSSSLTAGNGMSVRVEGVELTDADEIGSGLTLGAKVALPTSLRIVIPDGLKNKLDGWTTLLHCQSGSVPSMVEIVTKSGRNLTRKCEVRTVGNDLQVLLNRGLYILLK